MIGVKNHRFSFWICDATIRGKSNVPPTRKVKTMTHLTHRLLNALDRQRKLRATGGHFDERARLQSEIHDLRAAVAAESRRTFPV